MNDTTMMAEEPLIWTTKGNLPISILAASVTWVVTPEFVKMTETYRLDGEVVKESAHVCILKGEPVFAEHGSV